MHDTSRFHCTAQRPICAHRVPPAPRSETSSIPWRKTERKTKSARYHNRLHIPLGTAARRGYNGNKKAGSEWDVGAKTPPLPVLRTRPETVDCQDAAGKALVIERYGKKVLALPQVALVSSFPTAAGLSDHRSSSLPYAFRLAGAAIASSTCHIVRASRLAGLASPAPHPPSSVREHRQRRRHESQAVLAPRTDPFTANGVPRVSPDSRLMSRSAFRQRGLVLHNNSASQGCRGSTAPTPSPCCATQWARLSTEFAKSHLTLEWPRTRPASPSAL
ncbi:hypothetical protein DFH06DRAFT_1173489 [Mycena polygramma]|nr:hypothetical protein DFH06DRAFT_1173489 [Mycena polygramma]